MQSPYSYTHMHDVLMTSTTPSADPVDAIAARRVAKTSNDNKAGDVVFREDTRAANSRLTHANADSADHAPPSHVRIRNPSLPDRQLCVAVPETLAHHVTAGLRAEEIAGQSVLTHYGGWG